ncbi:MAG: hypothetical protein P1V51_01615 [Deltaproteobacteria bacterium]|nr:hypothetical protein [Deltaproteobacteria bacterium]
MAKKEDLKPPTEEAADPVRRGKRLRRYLAPKIRTLALPTLQASPACGPAGCPPNLQGCGPNVCGPVMPPPSCGPAGCGPRN